MYVDVCINLVDESSNSLIERNVTIYIQTEPGNHTSYYNSQLADRFHCINRPPLYNSQLVVSQG